jgi:hypothetical protein
MSDRARRPRRIPSIALAACIAGLLAATPAGAAEDPLDTLAGPPSSRFT